MITSGYGREAAFSAALSGDNALMEKAWQETGMYAEAVLHAHAHGRPSLKNLLQLWNKSLQKELENVSRKNRLADSANAIFAGLEKEPTLENLTHVKKHPLIEIVPPGMLVSSVNIPTTTKPVATIQNGQQVTKPLLLEAPPAPNVNGIPLANVTSTGNVTPPITAAPTLIVTPSVTVASTVAIDPTVAMPPTVAAAPMVAVASTPMVAVAPTVAEAPTASEAPAVNVTTTVGANSSTEGSA